jgi:hypothetical protein
MTSRERLPLWIGSGSPSGIERAALVGRNAPGLAKRAYVRLQQSVCLLVACRQADQFVSALALCETHR